MNTPMNTWLDPELQRGLRPVTAPPELWDRVQAAQGTRVSRSSRGLVWAMAATVAVLAIGLSVIYRDNVTFPALASDRCQNPAQLRAWVRARTGLDLPFRADSSPSIRLIGARAEEGRVEISYRAGNRAALLVMSRADAGSASVPHSRTNGNVSSWIVAGQRITLACADPAGLQLACKLCHLD